MTSTFSSILITMIRQPAVGPRKKTAEKRRQLSQVKLHKGREQRKRKVDHHKDCRNGAQHAGKCCGLGVDGFAVHGVPPRKFLIRSRCGASAKIWKEAERRICFFHNNSPGPTGWSPGLRVSLMSVLLPYTGNLPQYSPSGILCKKLRIKISGA